VNRKIAEEALAALEAKKSAAKAAKKEGK